MSLRNIMGKGEIADNKQFLIFPQCFLPFGKLSTIFIKFELVYKLFQFWKGLTFRPSYRYDSAAEIMIRLHKRCSLFCGLHCPLDRDSLCLYSRLNMTKTGAYSIQLQIFLIVFVFSFTLNNFYRKILYLHFNCLFQLM